MQSFTLAVLRRSRSPRPLNSSERSERNPKPWRSHIYMQYFTCFASAVRRHAWENLRSKVFHCAKLRDGTRDSVLALKIHAVIHMQSCSVTALFAYFAYFVVSPSTLAVLCTRRRCVGFSWAKHSVTKSSTHLLVFLVLKSTCSPAA